MKTLATILSTTLLFLAFSAHAETERTISFYTVDCSVKTETQQGDPDAAEENLTFYACSVDFGAGENEDLGTEDILSDRAAQLTYAIERLNGGQPGDTKNGTVSATYVTCTEHTRAPLGGQVWNSELESLVSYECHHID